MMQKHNTKKWLGAVSGLLLTAVCAFTTPLQAQDPKYTLTAGSGSGTPADRTFEVLYNLTTANPDSTAAGYCEVNGSMRLWIPLVNPVDTAYNARKGSHYLRLNIAGEGSIEDAATFDKYCVWSRSDSLTGYYYQEHDNYRYYLKGSSSLGGTGLQVVKVLVNQPISGTGINEWYDWDLGAALDEPYEVNGAKKSNYFWLSWDVINEQWSLSLPSSYERPDTKNYGQDQNGTNPRYYCYQEADPTKMSYHGALFLPVQYVSHGKEIQHGNENLSLTALALTETGSANAKTTLKYGESLKATPTIAASVNVPVIPSYDEYFEEVSRRGFNLSYKHRKTPGLGYAGVPTIQKHIYWTYDSADATVDHGNTLPAATTEALTINGDNRRITYSLDNRSRRYLSISKENANAFATVSCISMPATTLIATLTVTVEFTNGTSEQMTVNITVSPEVPPVVNNPVNAPVVRGGVFGGGRMADVTGNTAVTVHNCDNIAYVYGGNDISGRVQGSNGSLVTLGSASSTTGVFIGSVYGGGNGYYNYQYQQGTTNDFVEGASQGTQFKGNVWQWGGTSELVMENMADGSYIPGITHTKVVMNSDLVKVDTLFGGARNAFLTGYDANNIVAAIEYNHGVAYAVFGGNNVGGSLTSGKKVAITINNTKLPTSEATERDESVNTYFAGFGRHFGIRYLFGGGNMVNVPLVDMSIVGGRIDTCFAGGNSATVEGTTVAVNCPSATTKKFTNTTSGSSWVGGKHRYNVRCLFGGNNLATMAVMPTLTLTSGGIGTVYGGGNQGAMTAAVTPASAVTNDFTEARIINPPTKLSTTVLVNSDDMEIDYLYGGCRLANVTNSTYVKVTDGTIGTLFGGSNIGGRIGAEDDETEGTFVVMAGGTVKTNVFAGSNGYYHCNVNGKYTLTTSFSDADGELFDYYDDYAGLDIPTHQNTNLLILGGTVNGNAYGGANLTNVGYSSTRNGTVHLTMEGGTVNGNVFGGGNMASIYGLSYLFVTGNSVIDGGLYAGNDRVGRIETFSAKYKMKNAGAWVTDGAFTATDNTTQLNEYVDGKWQAAYSSYVRIEGSPHIHHVYGSGNGAYNYDGDYPQYGEPLVYCDLGGGNNRPIQSSSFIDLHPSNTNAYTDTGIDTVFGGGNGVSVRDEVVVLLNAENTTDRYVGTIFGGNNRDVMAMANNVPEVRLLKGKVGDVYGGGNAGAMQNTINLTDRCGNDVFGVSTHVKVESSDAIVEGDLYGGCRMADVKGMAYVEVYNTHDGGINTIYGGNNVSGRINGNTRVDISGGKVGTIYGGSNGYYDYVEIAANNYKVYDLGYSNDPAHLVATGASGSPKVSRTLVNVFGGTITDNVYGGGRLGDCDTTEVVVNDTVCSNGWGGATINGTIFGGGEGLWNNLSLPRRGNVDTVCYVHLYHATSVGSGPGEVKAYGGGRGGDVWNTYINVYPDWEQPFDAIYGGCWGSDVAGTTHVTMDGQLKEGARNATDVYGGNDFTGSVYKSIVTINSGRYTNVYGGGNGYYNGDLYVESNANHDYSTLANRLYVPNNEFAEVNFIDGHVENNIYGGGKMGTTFRYLRGGNGDYALDGNGRKQADTNSTTGYADINNYSIVEVNVHGGHISGNVYAGGAGDNKQLVYGVKVLNMEDGIVDESVYGGSENVDDGYRKECVDANTTTLRPSSIVNVTGGHITSHVFGGGYRGKVYGSTYVNLGVEAVENSTVWTSTIRGTDSAYAGLKPTLTAHQLVLVASVYGGANWGTNVGSEDFTVEGFAGGENRIRIDGLGYNTSQTESVLPVFSIANSVIGSGTSAKGGDVLSRIDILNYGHKSEFCDATRQLMSVQRAHQLWLNNTAIEYIGATDAQSAYTSVNYSINHIDSVNARGFNLIELDSPMDNIKSITFWEQELDGSGNLVKVTKEAMNDVVAVRGRCDGTDPVSICDKLKSISPDAPVPPAALEQRHTALLINSGKNINIMYKEGNPAVTKYGAVYGFAYLVAPSGKNATVVAKYKIPGTANDNNDGFVSTCDSLNKQYSAGSWVAGDATTKEYPYTNYGTTYRTWSLNKGIRSRQGVILANGTPSATPDVNKGLVVTDNQGDTLDHMVLALSTIDLPQTSPGHYYALTTESFVLTGDNEDLNLVDSAWYPNSWDTLPGNYQWDTSNAGMGHWDTASHFTGVKDIKQSPANTFGLIVATGDNFSTEMPAGHTSALPYTVISGTPRVNENSNFCTYKVANGDDQVTPKLNLFLTYDNSFSHTFIGSVRFTLKEYDTNGYDVGSDIEMEVIVSTVIRDFKPISCEVLAMNNEGRTNTFLRKTVLPATMQKRELYLTYVRWLPTNENGEDRDPATGDTNFKVAKDEATVLAETYRAGVPPTRFGLTVYPTDDVSSTLSSSIGWHSIAPDGRAINVWDLARKNDATPYNAISTVTTSADPNYPYPYADTVTQRQAGINKGRGKLVGVLDGRGLAALNVELTYNGNGVYAKHNGKGYIGKAILGFESWYNDESQGKFELTIYVKTRANGDTIYIASAETIDKPGMTGGILHNYQHPSSSFDASSGDKPGKSPDAYVRTFQEALSSRTYEEGDVIAILDKVTITGSENTTISGLDFAAIPVIRYDGHHNLWPGEDGVYRGTMIEVDGPGAILTARNIAFDGGCVSKINFNDNATHNYSNASDPQYIRVDDKGTPSLKDDFYADTNAVFGPVISVKNGGTMALGHGSTVMHNWNVTTDDALKGAVHVTSNGVLKIWNNLSIAENFSATLPGADKIKPLNGALYVDGGILQIASSNKDTKMDLTKSYLMPTSPAKWWAVYPASGDTTRYKVDMDVVVANHWTKANVFLTRTAVTPGADMDDQQSDVINLTAPMTADSRISVSKWFPGEETRDTIRIVNYSDPTYLQSAYTNANFESDVNWNVFYHTWVSSFNIYLHRCATFRQQEITNPATVLLHTDAGGDVESNNALEYVINEAATCPTGGEQLIYRVKGGFFPYLYEWSGAQSRTHNTVRYNKQVRDDIAKGLDSSFRRAIADTLVTVHAGMSHTEDEKLMTYNVSATDLAGCTVSKTAEITLQKVTDSPTPWQVTGTATNWTDTVSRLTATGTRQFKAIQITPYVRADRSSGIVTAIVDGANNDYVFLQEGEEHHDFEDYYFCEGDQLQLGTAPIDDQHFIMWDFDPYYSNPVTYIVPAESRDIIAYYGPSTYWYQTINTTAKAGAVYDEDNYYDARPTPTTAYTSTDGSAKAGYVTTYNGDVHIYDENGLAWFISVVNGLNGTQARPFYFNRVFLHKKSNGTPYDMKAHLWSPVGTQQHRFRGDFIGVSADETATTALTDDTVVIRNIIVDEPELANAGFFGFLDSAHVVRVKLESALVRGMQNVGAFAAQSTQSTFEDCSVAGHTEGAGDGTTTILTTHHTSGGFVARSENDSITNSHARAKYVGDAVYSGGVLGYSENSRTSVTNTSVRNDNRMEGLYIGGLAGYLHGNAPVPVQSKSNGTAVLANNYVYLNVNGKSQRVGGLVGYAANSLVENNYVHGTIYGTATEGGVGAVLDNGSMSDHNYYESSAVGQTVGQLRGNAIVNDNSNFSGQGNQVQLGTATYGVNNLTRVLNLWVRQHGGNYRTWRSDLENTNYGYPIYGEPDMIPVHDEFTYEGCDSIEWDGLLYNESVVLSSHVIDSLLMIDSTSTLHLVVHHSVSEQYADTTTLGQDYAGYGFNVSAAELDLLRLSVNTFGSATIVLSDTLTTATGCDSVINLSLTVTKDLGVVNAEPTDIKVYPNPTTARVTIETEGLSHVELFDNEGRRLQDYTARNAHEITIDVSSFATGAYYLRIHRGNDVTIQKLIKK